MPGSVWKPILPSAAGFQEIGTVSTTQQHPLGFTCRADHRPDTGASAGMADFIYVAGAAGTIASYGAANYTANTGAANGTTLLAGVIPTGSAALGAGS